jgi:hypothetical protein
MKKKINGGMKINGDIKRKKRPTPFYVGQRIVLDKRVDAQVLKGDYRREGDLAIEIRIDRGRWYRTPIALVLLLAACKGQVEDNNYPTGDGFYKLMEAIREAAETRDWETVAAKIAEDHKRAEQRRRGELNYPPGW